MRFRFLAAFVLALFVTPSWAAPGDLDTSFGGGAGWVSTGFQGLSSAQGRSVIQQADSKLLVAGYSSNGSNNDFALTRYNTDGSLDTTFNGTGKLITAIGAGNDEAYSVIQQADGKLVAAGISDNGSNADIAVVRYNIDGSLDATFNVTGKVTTAIGASTDYGYSVIQQADGKLVVAGYSGMAALNNDFALVRYNIDGSLDTTFSGDGKVTTAIGAGIDLARSVIQQSDGKLVVAGSMLDGNNADFALVRYNSDGSLDASFDGDGKVTTAIGTSSDVGFSVIQQADGKLVVAGYSNSISSYDFALARYNGDGSLDASFDGDGKLTTNITFGDYGYSVIQQTDGKLVVVGSNNSNGYWDFALARYNSDGSLDTSFDGDGKLITAVGINFDSGYSVIQQADGKLVVAGYVETSSSDDDIVVVRYNADGSLDTSFDGDGKLTTSHLYSSDKGQALLQQADGKLVAMGYGGSDSDAELVRYNADGSLDTSFDGDGKLTALIGTGYSQTYSMIQQADGKLVVAGVSYNGSDYDFELGRYNSDGSLDASFDGDGKLTTAIGIGSNEQAYSMIQQVDGKLVVAGTSDADFALVRYNADGSLDTTFNSTGKVITAIGAGADYGRSVIQQADGKLVVVGYSNNGSNNDFALVRYNTDGSLDTSFDNDGKLTTAVGTGTDYGYSVIQQTDGKLVVAGLGNSGFALARYNTDGSLDVSFDGDGKLTTMVGTGAGAAYSVIQQSDGKLVAVGYSLSSSNYNLELVRYNGDGSLDSSFAGDGKLTTTIGSGDATGYSVIQQADGKLAVVGYAEGMPTGQEFIVVRYESGQLDTDGDGLVDWLDADNDNDGVPNASDAFPLDASESVDTDGDGIGDNADTTPNGDTDSDGIDNAIDNCVSVSNSDQLNTDGDAQGDACDSDDDNDGVADISDAFPLDASESFDTDSDTVGDNTDNCVAVANTNQLDTDTDGAGDVCDNTPNGDTDNDGIDNAIDNCVSVSNTDQLNTDGDAQGNVCDNDDDNDNVADTSDAFPLDATESVDTDSDAVGDNADNCVAVANTNQLDVDTDGTGDVCDTTPNGDTDNDGIDNLTDNCISVSNVDQLNADADTQGDACDSDDDNDGVQDVSDNCPLIANSNQLDYDADNIGDACDDAVPLPEDIAGVMKNAKAGSSVAFAGDVNGDGYGDYVIGMPGYDIPAAPPVKTIQDAGRAEVISGKTGAVLMSVNGVAAKDAMGFAVAGNGDIDNDGFDDVLVGAPNADDFAFGVADAGSVTILFGPNGARTLTFIGKSKKSLSGSAVALADVNGDNHADIIIGAPKADDVTRNLIDAGNVTVLSGDGYTVLNTLYVAKEKSHAGSSVAAGDINHDGKADIIIGAPNDDDATNNLKNAGSVSVYGISGTELLRKYGAVANAHFGKSVAAGDVNNDGVDDVLVGAPDDDNSKLKDVGSVTVYSGSDGSSLVKKFGAVTRINLGNSVAAGDVNADGYADIIAGAWKDNAQTIPKITKDTGSVSVWSGNGYALIDTVYGDAAHDYFGTAVSTGDINGDGKSDLIIGIPGFGLVVKDAGAVRVLSGAGL